VRGEHSFIHSSNCNKMSINCEVTPQEAQQIRLAAFNEMALAQAQRQGNKPTSAMGMRRYNGLLLESYLIKQRRIFLEKKFPRRVPYHVADEWTLAFAGVLVLNRGEREEGIPPVPPALMDFPHTRWAETPETRDVSSLCNNKKD
jgi:hypothetical protein